MNLLESKLQSLRVLTRNNSKFIIDKLIENHISRIKSNASKVSICMFCGTSTNVTKEHVLPRWTFEKCTKGFFITDINGMNQTYNTTTIPTCLKCNSDLLNTLEKHILNLFSSTDVKENPFSFEETQNIIRWLEIIDYKFQILNSIRKFKASKHNGYFSYLSDIPLSLMRVNGDFSITKVIAEIRRSQKRITVKEKSDSINSLVVFKTKNQGFNFFHQMDEFIFIELPTQQVAIFYFYRKKFKNIKTAHDAAMVILKEFYN